MKIKSISKRQFSGKVYNFHTTDENNYFANGILVHNCYKSNTGVGDYMNFETFKKLFDVLNKAKTMTQIAFGTGASLTEDENPDYWKIFQYAKDNGVTPNVTIFFIIPVCNQSIIICFCRLFLSIKRTKII